MYNRQCTSNVGRWGKKTVEMIITSQKKPSVMKSYLNLLVI